MIHVPRTAGTRLTAVLQELAPEAVADVFWLKHASRAELPDRVQRLRTFCLVRPIDVVRRSFYQHTVKWYISRQPDTIATVQWLEYAARVAGMTWEEFDRGRDLFPRDLTRWTDGADTTFDYEASPWDAVARYCKVPPARLAAAMRR